MHEAGRVAARNGELEDLGESQHDLDKRRKKEESRRNREAKRLLFDEYLNTAERSRTGDQSIGGFFAALC